ncbi:hypothetical protein BCY89_05680 [Sphingobacterium siyangense]|uniref:Uncharacterized protein n=1 Tax=Sphingobacterium siyangense TaxID=459529 RepID=A0A420FW75_9SPHI|nr:hypothetical protein [Sphingobacterium siyangense]RKF37141.1 hypothetical protein BCY89_05680 [Sphingobacterium siyangense]
MRTKNLIKAMSIITVSLLYSCSSELETEDMLANLNKNSSQLASRESACELFSSAIESTIIPGVKAVNLENGISTSCHNNILIFPTLQDYENSIVKLDQLIDEHNDAFDQQTANMTDVEADDYADEIGFDEDLPLVKFEEDLGFCSLRQRIDIMEEEWLSQQGDGAWNLDFNPDSHYIDDETERALLSVASEFIVGNCKIGYTYIKKFDWGTVEVEINDLGSLSTFIAALNNIVDPSNINGATLAQVSELVNATNSPNKIKIKDIGAVLGAIGQVPPSECRDKVKEKDEHIFNGERRIIWKHKYGRLLNGGGNIVIRAKSITKSYRKKKSKWKKYRATISAGFSGSAFFICSTAESLDSNTSKKRKRIKLMKYTDDIAGNNQQKKLKPNGLFSTHTQEGNSYQNDVY